MKKIPNAFDTNMYLGNCNDSVFTALLREKEITDNIGSLNECEFVHGLIQYPQWNSTSDVFQYLKIEIIEKMKNKTCFFIFDASTEGFSPIYNAPFFDLLYYNCKKYDVDPSMIIFVSANLRDEETIQEYTTSRNLKPINVFSFLSFERVVNQLKNIDIAQSENLTAFNGKYFSSLSRVNRYYRSIATFLLCQSEISKYALISHNKILVKKEETNQWRFNHHLTEYNDKTVRKWLKSLPRTIDQTNFKINWALEGCKTIHEQTLFQVVNETLVDNENDTSMFYSEKTFRPIANFQPFVIYGQQNCNKELKKYGYKLYDEWFDLDFDSEPDNILRYKKLLSSITETCNYLQSLSVDKQIEWRFKNKEILKHNQDVMATSIYSRKKLLNFLLNISKNHETN